MKVDKMYKWLLDSREGRNQVFVDHAAKENEAAVIEHAEPRWVMKRLTLSHFIHLKEGVKDLDCADMTNENGDGIVTFKSYEDLIGSTTGDNSHHLEEEVIKIFATGIPACIIIWGPRIRLEAKTDLSEDYILAGLQKFATVQAIYKIPAIWVDTAREAIECGKTFIRHCNELPRKLPIYCLLKREGEIAVLVGFEKVAEKTARLIMKAWKGLVHLWKFIIERVDIMTDEEIAQELKVNTPGLRIDQARSIISTTLKNRR